MRLKKLRVLIVIDSLQVGGAERSILDMMPHMTAIDWVVCHLYVGSQLQSDYLMAGARIYSPQLEGHYEFFKAYRFLVKVVKRENPDLIHGTLLRSSLVSRLVGWTHKIPVLCSLVADSYSSERYSLLTQSRRVKLKLFELLDRWSVKWCASFIAISQQVAASNAKALRIPFDRIAVIYRGRNPENYMMTGARQRSDAQPLVLISVGRLVPSKGHELVISALTLGDLRNKNVKLLIVGAGPQEKVLAKLVVELDLQQKVELLGERDDVNQLLARAHVFLFPSYHEGLGGALIEAMMSGLPIVCSDIPVFRELVTGGTTALLAPSGDPMAWSQAILRLIDDPVLAEHLGKNARLEACQKFDIRNVASAYERLYYSICENSSTRYKKAI